MRREDFPIFKAHKQPFIYLDSAAMSFKPEPVLQAMDDYNRCYSANIHRGLYPLAEEATAKYEGARAKVAEFLGAKPEEIIFTKNATEGINCITNAYLFAKLKKGDEILISPAEHHSNYLPWLEAAKKAGAKLKIMQMYEDGRIDVADAINQLSAKTKMVAVTLVSNVTGALTLATELVEACNKQNIPILLDASQAAPHLPINLARLKADFLVASGYKMYGPTGIGVLFVRGNRYPEMTPWQFGGDMVKTVRGGEPVWNDPPHLFEAGTSPIAEAIGLGAAADWLMGVGFENIARHDAELTEHGLAVLGDVPGFRLLGPASPIDRLPIFTLAHESIHSHDLAGYLAEKGISARAGQHCAAPLLEALGVNDAVRLSCGIYTTPDDLTAAAKALGEAVGRLTKQRSSS